MESIPPQKRCTKCGETFPIDAFIKGPRYADGYQPWCLACRRAYREMRRADPELLEKERKRLRDHFRTNTKARERNRSAGRLRDRERWHTDAEYRERKNAWQHEHYHSDAQYRRKRIDAQIARTHRRRSAIASSGEHFTQGEWRTVCEKYGHRCLRCGRRTKLTPDHIVPLSRGGANTIQNIQPLCLRCNLSKHAKTIDYRPLEQKSMEWD